MAQIREADIGDARNIAEISTNSLGYPCSEELVKRRLTDKSCTNQKIFVAAEAGKAVGFVHAELYRLLYQEDSVNILSLAVEENARKKGYGKLLIQSVEVWAEQMNCTKVRLNSEISRTGAHSFYEKLGFRNTKAQKRFEKEIDSSGF